MVNHVNLEEIYNRNVDSIYKVCFLYMKNKSDAEDAVQSTFVKLVSSDIKFQDSFHEHSWLIRVAKNICKNMLRHWSRKNISIEDCNISMNAPFEESESDLWQKVLELPEKNRLIIFLYYYEGHTTSQIAKILKMNESSVRSRLLRGRKKLKLVIEGERSGYER